MTELSLRNPIAVLMASIALCVFALVVTPRMSVDTFPELSPPTFMVGTLAPGLGPKDIEKTISARMEKYVSATPGVERVESVSRNGLSILNVWLEWDTDLNEAQALIEQQVGMAMAAIPKSLGVLPPITRRVDPSDAPVVQIAIYGGDLSAPKLYDYAYNVIEPAIEAIPGVASASVNGGRRRQINVVVDRVAAQARGVRASEVAAAIHQANALLPSGQFAAPEFNANVYTDAVPDDVEDLGNAVLRVVDGSPVYLKDVAAVIDGGSPETQNVTINGQSAVYLNVRRIPGGNTIAIVDEVRSVVDGLEDLPPGLEVTPIFDSSTFVRTSYEGLKHEIVLAFGLIALVILIFLQSPRGVLVSLIAIPISFSAILLVLYATGQTLNAFTLGGLTLAMGPLVDISVVVIEAIHRRGHASDPWQASLEGARSVATPAFAATLTTTAVLLPVLLLTGLAKKLFVPLALTVATGMAAGYIVSMTVTPVACRYLLRHRPPGAIARWFERMIERLVGAYVGSLRAVLPYRAMVIVGVAVLVAGSAWTALRIPSTFFPEVDESAERVYVRLLPGTSIKNSATTLMAMGQLLEDELPPGTVELVLTNVGTPTNARSAMRSPNLGPHMGFIRLALTDPGQRQYTQRELADRARALLDEHFPGVAFLQRPGGLVASVFANGFPAPLVVEVRGGELTDLEVSARQVAEVARTVPGVRDIVVTLDTAYPEVRVETPRGVAGLVGISSRTTAQTTLQATAGNINAPSTWIDPSTGMSYYVITSYESGSLVDISELRQIPVAVGPSGESIPLGAYSTLHRSVGPVAIERSHGARVARVLMQTEGRDIGTAAEELERKLHDDPRTRGVRWSFVGQVELMRSTFSGLGVAIGLAVMVVFMIMASQFKSLRLPFVMLFTVPVALVGVVLALVTAGQGFSVTALMGVLMVVGISVSNGILLIDEANTRLHGGATRVAAILGAARVRFVPIAMTSLATTIGLLPVALGLQQGTEANQPLALAVVGGLSASTMLSLFLIPSIFLFIAPRPRSPA